MSETKRNVPKLRFPGFTEDWEQCKLGEILKVNSGKDYKHLENGDIPVYGTGGYMLSVNEALSDVDAIGIGRKGTIDKPQYLKAPFWTVDTLFYLVPLEKYSCSLLYHLSNLIPWKKFDESTGVPSLSKSTIDGIQVNIPKDKKEQDTISMLFDQINNLITLHQRKLENLKLKKKALLQKLFPKNGEQFPELRFPGFTDAWEQRKFSELYEKVTEKNDLSFKLDKVISVASMYYKSDAKVSSEEYLKTYNIFRYGEIAFEGNKSKEYSYGRFVENTIGDGIVSHVFEVFKPIAEYDIKYWKYFINYEPIMGKILSRCTKKTTMMTNLVAADFLKEEILVPKVEEQAKIGEFISKFDNLITLHQRKLQHLQLQKKALLQQMFV